MAVIILPTAEIVQEANTYNHYFDFLDEGIRKVVADAARAASASRQRINSAIIREELDAVSSFGNNRSEFNFSSWLTRRFLDEYLEYLSDGSGKQFGKGLDSLSYDQITNMRFIETVVSDIEDSMVTLINTILMDKTTEIQIGDFPWIGNDLIIITKSPFRINNDLPG